MASRSINEVTLLGNLTRDPELKYTPAGTAVCSFGLATNRTWTTADGQTKEDVQYHRLVAWQKLAELCSKLLIKGRKVWLRGRITYRDYTDKAGQPRHITEIVVDDFIVFNDGRKSDSKDEAQSGKPVQTAGNSEIREDSQSAPHEEIKHEEKPNNSLDVNPDDIPF